MPGRSDRELLEDLLVLESRLVSAYEAALRRDVLDASLGAGLLAQERDHVAALRKTLGSGAERNPRATVPSPELTRALGSRAAFARFAERLEARAVTAYAEAAASIRDARLRQPLGSIMACEAAHRVALRDSLGERPLVV
jgi:Ferritin-like domain